MVSVFRIVLTMLAGSVLGFLLALFLVFLFVDMDMVLMFYVAGIAVGALLGAAYGLYSLRSHRAPSA